MSVKIIFKFDAGGKKNIIISKRIIIPVILIISFLATGIVYAALEKPYTFKRGDIISAKKLNENFDTLYEKMNSLEEQLAKKETELKQYTDGKITETSNNLVSTAGTINDALKLAVPPGTVIAYAGSTIPEGYLLCDGSSISRATYSNLFKAIGIIYGVGDGSTTFNLPDYRGLFLRGHHFGKSSSTTDPDNAFRKLGELQGDLVKAHQHLLPYSNGATAPSGTHSTPPWQGVDSTQHSTFSTGGSENRPANISVAYIIKI